MARGFVLGPFGGLFTRDGLPPAARLDWRGVDEIRERLALVPATDPSLREVRRREVEALKTKFSVSRTTILSVESRRTWCPADRPKGA